MHPKLQYHFNRLEETKGEILAQISPMTPDAFAASAPGKWSLGEVLTHIVTSEQLALQYMRKKSLGLSALRNAGVIEPIKLLLLKLSQRLPIKYNAPTAIINNTPAFPGKDEIISVWKKDRDALMRFLETINENDVDKKIFKHPIAGMFNASQGLDFLREHIIHHQPQIKRLISKAK
jgi:hypothetical protein